LATTNPIPVNDLRSFPAGTQQVGGGNQNEYTVFKSVVRGNDIHQFVSNGPTLANGTLGDLF
jgi:hypothetical protein